MICSRTFGIGVLSLACLGVLAMSIPSSPAADEDKPAALLRHVVLFKFKPEVTKPQVQEVVDAFAALPKKIDTIVAFEWGTDVSVEMKSEGFTHCFVVSFKDAKARDEYLPHAAHGEFVKLVGPRIEKVLVFDFSNGK
jgi:stress responsive alpha/beta barrel protein